MTVKVSVIIPVYNNEKYLFHCMESVLSQTLKDIEVICIDDGSKDKSLEMLYEYQKKDSRVTVIAQSNQGAGCARNRGIRIASGEFVAFLDSDDFYPGEHALELLYTNAVSHKVNICGGSLLFYNGKTTKPAVTNENIEYFFKEDGLIAYSDFQQDYYYQRFLYKTSFLRENYLLFPLYLRHQDPPFFIRALATAKYFYAIKENVYTYRSGDNHVKWTPKKILDMFSGITDDLHISSRFELDTLYERVAKRIERQWNYTVKISPIYSYPEMIITMVNLYKALHLPISKGLDIDTTFLEKYFKDNGLDELDISYGKTMEDSTYRPQVSVVIPVYNVEDYLRECLDSILNQTLHEIEVICVNDGSTDGSLAILEEYAAKDERITIVTQKNRGLSGARNTGAKFARGEFLYFIDSDDFIDAEALEYLYQEAHDNQLDILYFDGESFYQPEELRQQFPGVDCCYREKEYSEVVSGEELYVRMSRDGRFRPMVWLQFFSHAFYYDNKLSFYEGIMHEDVQFSYITVLKAKRVSHRRKAFYHYRRRKGAITSNLFTFRHVYGKLICLMTILDFMEKNRFKNETIQRMSNYLTWLASAMKDTYNVLSESEKEKEKDLSAEEKNTLAFYLQNHRNLADVIQTANGTYIPKIIVSLTTWPARINTVHIAIKSILEQTYKPDKVLLYLAKSQFPELDSGLPESLKKMRDQGLEIRWCDEDLKSHKKYYYAMRDYPEDIIITVDDDLIYESHMVEKLLKSYKSHPYAVSAMRTHLMKFDGVGNVLPYKEWVMEQRKVVGIPSMRLFATSGAGTLYPPHCMSKELFNKEILAKLCLKADDIWLKIMQVMANTPVVLVTDKCWLKYVPDTQDVALYKSNGGQGQNDVQIQNVLNYYGQFRLENGLSISERVSLENTNSIEAKVNQKENETLKRQEEKIKKLEQDKIWLKNKNADLERHIHDVKTGYSFRIGRVITYFPRMVRGGRKCLKEHTLGYTIRRTLWHLGLISKWHE